MNRWKLVVGVTVGFALFGCEKPPPPVDVDVDKPPPVVDADLEKAKELVAEGEKLLAERKLDEAEAKANEALALKPELEEAKALLAKVKAERAKLTDAEKQKIEADRAKKKKIADLLNEANGLFDKGKLDESLAKLNDLLKLDAKNLPAKKLADKIQQAKKDKDAAAILARKKADIRKKANDARARRQWEVAEKLYKQLAKLETDARKKAQALDRAAYCAAMGLYDQALRAKRAGRLEETRKLLTKAMEKKRLPQIKAELDRVNEMIRQKAKQAQEIRRFDESMKKAKQFEAQANIDEAINVLKEALRLNVGPRLLEASKMMNRLTKARTCREQAEVAEAALAEEPPNYAAAAQAYEKIRSIKGELSAESQEKLIECKFQMAVKRGDEAQLAEVPDYAEAIEAYEEALSYKEDEDVAQKLEEVKDLKAAVDFDAFVAKAGEATADGREGEAVDALDLAVRLAEERPNAVDAKKLAGAKNKLKRATAARKRKLTAELAAKWREVSGNWKKALRGDPRAALEILEAEKQTFEGSRYARNIDAFIKTTNKKIDSAASREWNKVKRKVDRSEEYGANIQLLKDLLEKVKGTKYEQMTLDLLAAQEQALKEAPPEEPEKMEPAEGAGAEAPPEPPVEPAPE